MHSEDPTKELLQQGGVQELIQLWINVPKAHKGDAPFYQSATWEEQPRILQQEGVDLRLASGEYEGITGPLKSFTPVTSISGSISQGKRVQLSAVPGYWTLLYIANGKACINQESVNKYHLVIFEKANDEFILTAEEDTQLLFLSAEPISDHHNGIFGNLSW
jgi:redox-sensitive bicupin YhaK (pirin superfamily)